MDALIAEISGLAPFRGDLDYKILRAVMVFMVFMVFTFYMFGIQKWSAYTAEMLVPPISHSPVVFWLEPAFGVRGAGFFLGTSELTFGTLLLLGYWAHRLGILGALGSLVTFLGTSTIIPFLPDAWAEEAGGFPIVTSSHPVTQPALAESRARRSNA